MARLRIRSLAASCVLGALSLTPPIPASAEPAILEWADLIPPGAAAAARRLPSGSLPSGLVQHGQLAPEMWGAQPGNGALNGGGADAIGAIDSLRSLQPPGGEIRSDLDGREVRIAGFVTPLGFDGSEISEFLLVPYVGACIHVPPPPANQIVFVSGVENYEAEEGLLYPVWVTGTLRAVPLTTDLADVGYQIEGAKVEDYE